MDWGDDRRPLEEGPRVRVRGRLARDAGGFPLRTDSLRRALRDVESRFLVMQSGGLARSSTETLASCLTILEQLGGIHRHIQEAADRQDIPYLVERRLTLLSDHCQWLTRRVSTEFLLVLRIRLEQEFRRVVSPEAYQAFQRIRETEDAAREIEATGDLELMARLRDGTLLRGVLEQIRLRDVAGLDQSEVEQDPLRDPRP